MKKIIKEVNMDIGARIAILRTRNNMTLTDLAEKIGVTSSAVHKWEHGHTSSIKVDKVEAMAKALNTTVEYLMGYVDDPHEKLGSIKLSDEETELRHHKSLQSNSFEDHALLSGVDKRVRLILLCSTCSTYSVFLITRIYAPV